MSEISPQLQPHKIDFAGLGPVSHDPGVTDREAEVNGVRCATVEYLPGSGRDEWCDSPHILFVISGEIRYEFEDGRDPIEIGPGEAIVLPSTPRHRGSNSGDQPARLFAIDAIPG